MPTDSDVVRIFTLLIVNLFVFEYAPPNLSSLFVTPVSATGCIAVCTCHRLLMAYVSDRLRIHRVEECF